MDDLDLFFKGFRDAGIHVDDLDIELVIPTTPVVDESAAGVWSSINKD
jgi:hypothetical protein